MRSSLRLILTCAALACLFAALPATASAGAKPKTVWLCKPKLDDNPCEPGLRTTQLSNSGEQLEVKKVKRDRRRRVDCFYVYPTVSDQPGPQANLDIDPVLRSVALYQAARFSRHCRVFAPVYRQATLSGIGGSAGDGVFETAYSDVRRAWKTYRRKHNDGRGVVLIGHSQGTFMLRRLVAEEIDPKRSARRKLVSALLLGGDVTVKAGKDKGGDFDRVKACRKRGQIGCVVAFSAFNGPVPEDAVFGRTDAAGLDILCTDPSRLGARSGKVKTVYPSEPFAPGTIAAAISLVSPPPPEVSTPWLQYKDAYTTSCSTADGASVLQVATRPGATELTPIPNAAWGLHLADVNIALGNLSDMVRRQARKFARERG